MGVIGIILLIAFIIICLLLVGIVLLQNEEGGGFGGLFGGGNSSAFGSRSANVLTKTTYVLVTLFFLSSFALALIHKAPSVKSLDAAAQQVQTQDVSGQTWLDEDTATETAPAEVSSAETE